MDTSKPTAAASRIYAKPSAPKKYIKRINHSAITLAVAQADLSECGCVLSVCLRRSALFEMGRTRFIAAAYGPREVGT
jgi:hypothetical protein